MALKFRFLREAQRFREHNARVIAEHIAKARVAGEVIATRRWAHWKDGVQYVGSCGTTLAQAMQEIDARAAPTPEEIEKASELIR